MVTVPVIDIPAKVRLVLLTVWVWAFLPVSWRPSPSFGSNPTSQVQRCPQGFIQAGLPSITSGA